MADTMKELVVCIFDGQKKADEAQKAIQALDKRLEVVKLGHIAIIHKNDEGKVTLSETGAPGRNWGKWSLAAGAAAALASAATGGAILIPAILGGGAVAVATRFIDTGFPDKSLKEIGDGLELNQSALVTIVDNPQEREIVETELHDLGGRFVQGSLPEDLIQRLGAAAAAAVPEAVAGQEQAAEGETAGLDTGDVAVVAVSETGGEQEPTAEGEGAAGLAPATLAASAAIAAVGAIGVSEGPEVAEEGVAGTDAAAAEGNLAPTDDLRLIPDIGPVYERLLHMIGVRTYAQLAAMRPDELQRVFSGHDPVSGYPIITASMDEAKAIIDVAGMRAQGKTPQNLREIPGVGPVYERMLMRQGIITYAQLAALRPEELQAMFTGYDPETNQRVEPIGLDEAGLMIMDAQRLVKKMH